MEGSEILDTSVAIERRNGTITIFTTIEYPKSLEKNFEVVWPTQEEFIKATEISSKLYAIGKPVPAIDILISSIAISRNMKILTKDKHFGHIKEVEKELQFEVIF